MARKSSHLFQSGTIGTRLWTTIVCVGLVLIAICYLLQGPFARVRPASIDAISHTTADKQSVQNAYEQWKSVYAPARGKALVLPIGWSRGLSVEYTEASGVATFDLADGTVTIEVQGGLDERPLTAWLVDNKAGNGRTVLPERGDGMVRLGMLHSKGDTARLHTVLDAGKLSGFQVDLVVVTRGGKDPATGGLLYGAPTLFQRMYHSAADASPGVRLYAEDASDRTSLGADLTGGLFRTLFAPSPQAGKLDIDELVEVGEELFANETFDGNGRTCATCHRFENNFTIDADFIATLPDDDPLFVAEFVDALNAEKNGGYRFENPKLMRQFGLIVENVDGHDELASKFVMRGVPHIFAQRLTLDPDPGDGTTSPPMQRTGWGGDGSPGGGTLREFAVGAVTQHFPKTLNRTPGVDFRLPTEFELDALEAFQLSVGRQEELNLALLTFTDADVADGALLFQGQGRGGECCACSTCHVNGGGTSTLAPGMNTNFDTGVEDLPHSALAQGEIMPRDGGFGRDANPKGGFGDGTFNTPPIVEAADTPPFFHNNSVNTVEEAIAFYETDAFNNSPARLALLDNPVDFSEEEISQMGKFLRVINAVDNVRETKGLLERAKVASHSDRERTRVLLRRGLEEGLDARKVLEEVLLHPQAIHHIEEAGVHISEALESSFLPNFFLIASIHEALTDLNKAERSMVKFRGRDSAETAKAATGDESSHEAGFALMQNHPNPFNPETAIQFRLPETRHVVIRIFNSLGQEVNRLADGPFEAGVHEVRWRGDALDGRAVSSGLYFYRLDAGAFTAARTMILAK